MNTHELLKDYHGRSDYGAIAQNVAYYVKHNNTTDVEEVMRYVAIAFPQTPKLTMREQSPLNIFGRDYMDETGRIHTMIENSAIEQMKTALKIPVAIKGALMPDSHQGYALPIGGVISLDNAISPSFIGYDISCMVKLTMFHISKDEFYANRTHLANILKNVTRFGRDTFEPNERQHKVMSDERWSIPSVKNYYNLALSQLGTSGGGNHFADLVEIVNMNDEFVGIGLLTHSGSRGTGHKLATYYMKKAKEYTDTIAKDIPNGYEWFDMRTAMGQEYYQVMQLMGAYAEANHELMHQHFMLESGLDETQTYQNKHNYAWKSHTHVVHRKGATPAGKGEIGLIPGSSGTPSYVVIGNGNRESLYSSSHGAGRVSSRTLAKQNHNEVEYTEHMDANDILTFGLAKDETYQAYKNIDIVMQGQQDCVFPLYKMFPKVVIMGGDIETDDG